eukprot:4004688-Pyramimonas_sp.AAC.1
MTPSFEPETGEELRRGLYGPWIQPYGAPEVNGFDTSEGGLGIEAHGQIGRVESHGQSFDDVFNK